LQTFEELGFGDAWVSHKQHIYVPPRSVQILFVVLLNPAKQRKGQCLFDLPVPINRRSNGVEKLQSKVGLLRELLKQNFVDILELHKPVSSFNIVDLNEGMENGESIFDVEY